MSNEKLKAYLAHVEMTGTQAVQPVDAPSPDAAVKGAFAHFDKPRTPVHRLTIYEVGKSYNGNVEALRAEATALAEQAAAKAQAEREREEYERLRQKFEGDKQPGEEATTDAV